MNETYDPTAIDKDFLPSSNGNSTEERAIIPLAKVEIQPDNALVNEAHSKLSGIFLNHYQKAIENAMLEAGRYIIKNFLR